MTNITLAGLSAILRIRYGYQSMPGKELEEDVQGTVDVLGALHVNAHEIVTLGGGVEHALKVCARHILTQIETKLGQLQGEIAIDASRADGMENRAARVRGLCS